MPAREVMGETTVAARAAPGGADAAGVEVICIKLSPFQG